MFGILGDKLCSFEICKDIWWNVSSVSNDPDSDIIETSIRIFMFRNLGDLISQQAKESIDFFLRSIEVLDREGIDGDMINSESIADV